MISCNEFILAYSELFKELERSHGKKDVEKMWKFFSDTYCKKLESHVKNDGLKGMYDYWTGTMGEEGGRYKLTLRDDEFILDMHYCPSVGKLLNTHVEPYEDYCGHCPALYNSVIERYGFDVDYYIINPEKAECRIHVRPKKD
jgi:hypothetical protein